MEKMEMKMKKCFLIIVLFLFAAGILSACGSLSEKTDVIELDNEMADLSNKTPASVSDRLGFDCEDVIGQLKAARGSISDYTVFDAENDPNGTDHAYLQKAIFLDDACKEGVDPADYKVGHYASGTIELFASEKDAENRANELQTTGSDVYSIRIIADKVLLRLNNEYTDRDAQSIASAMNGSIYSMDDDVAIVNPMEVAPLATYEQIKQGGFSGQEVCIQAVVSDVSVRLDYNGDFSYAYFDLWYESGGTYICDQQCRVSDSQVKEYPYLSPVRDVRDGDIVKIVVRPFSDNSFGTSQCSAIEIVGHRDINEIYSEVIRNTPTLQYEKAERNPNDYKNGLFVVKGSVFQIVKEGSLSCEYLIKTADGIVYVDWYSNEEARGSRILENAPVTVYGKFEGLTDYATLVGNKKVPKISASVVIMSDLFGP